MVESRTFNSSLYCFPQIGCSVGIEIYYFLIPWNILHVAYCPSLILDAIAGGWIYALVTYFVLGRFSDLIVQYHNDSFNNLVTISLVVIMFCPLGYAIHRYYYRRDSFGTVLAENYVCTALLIIFSCGLSTHLSRALLCHLLSIDIQWDATAKVLSILL